jgi:hydrogenase/urease accessory protein HupE
VLEGKSWTRLLWVAAAAFAVPAAASAHGASGDHAGLGDGLRHPLLGWDHLLAMLAVGVWAAQQRGRAALAIPAAFLAAMSLGGFAGARGVAFGATEASVALSVLAFGALALFRVRCAAALALPLVAGLAFCHGLAHGNELPGTASLASFGAGFTVATAALHGAGWLLARAVSAAIATMLVGHAAVADADGSASEEARGLVIAHLHPPEGVEEIVVEGRATPLVRVAESASSGTIGARELERRPTLRPGEVLETIPGVILTQHAGGGKANQFFLRGFNLDHGTDFATSVGGIPVNLPSHGHGQGYTDLNLLIPELVERVHFRKGPYYADVGDFASAGSAEIEYFDRLDQSLVHVEVGRFGHQRAAAASSLPVAGGDLLFGGEFLHQDGPWKGPDDFVRGVGVLRYSRGDADNGARATAMAYHGSWSSSDQIAESAVDDAVAPIGRFGALDDDTGGESQRYGLSGDWHRSDSNSATKVGVYGFYYDLDLVSNFTYFLADPLLGDEFEQQDERWTAGLDARHTWFTETFAFDHEASIGFQLRNDAIENGLFDTVDGAATAKAGGTLPAVVRDDRIWQTSLAPYAEVESRWLDWMRTVAGVRLDAYRFDVDDRRDLNSGTRWDVIASPKGTLVLGPWYETELYFQGGLGFHSNDARGVNLRNDPITGTPFDSDGNRVERADPLVRTKGAEIGLRNTAVPGLQSTLAFWWLAIDSELLFVGDAGTTEASRPSRRYGVEFANYWTPLDWLTLDADVSLSHARFRDHDTSLANPTPGASDGNQVPGAIESVVAAGITAHDWHGLSASLRLRYFGPRPLVEDDSVRSDRTLLLSAGVEWKFWEHWRLSAELFNLLDRHDHDIEYFYESQISPSAAPLEQKHVHPVEPISLRVGLTAQF